MKNMALCKLEVVLPKLPDEHWHAIRCAMQVAEREGVCAYLVGGFVRDALLGLISNDIDTAVDGDPFDYAQALSDALSGKFVRMHEEPKVARVVIRTDGGKLLHFDITGIEGSLERDLMNRDFTINAFAIPLSSLRCEGDRVIAELRFPEKSSCYEDLRNGIIRMHAGAEGELIRQDPVRMLRAFRFAATLKFEIAPQTLASIREHSCLLRKCLEEGRCSWERVRDEFAFSLQSDCGSKMLTAMDEVGLLSAILPELEDLKNVPAQGYHHLDGFRHSVEAVRFVEMLTEGISWLEEELREFGVPLHEELRKHIESFMHPFVERRTGMFVLKMATLLHDIGKPLTMRCDEDGDLHFFGHETAGAEIAERICERLKLSKREKHLIVQAIRMHMRPLSLAKAKSLTNRALRRFWMDNEEVGLVVVIVSFADLLATRGPDMTLEQMIDHMRLLLTLMQTYNQIKMLSAQPKLLSGDDVMERYGLPQGPIVGKALRIVTEAQLKGEIKTKEEAFALLDRVIPTLLSKSNH
ncbi:MAG: hypothetical protein HZRFUVUK_000771 [Candidatus Fervidibacterota bacterium]|jgi:putative nucleotidyltransferase with HDIG domain